MHAGIPPPREQTHPPGSRHPPGADTPQEQTPPQDQTPPGKQTPAYGLPAAGTHPTGMHSCYYSGDIHLCKAIVDPAELTSLFSLLLQVRAPLGWKEARNICRSDGADLVTISSDLHNIQLQMVSLQLQQDLFIGLYSPMVSVSITTLPW